MANGEGERTGGGGEDATTRKRKRRRTDEKTRGIEFWGNNNTNYTALSYATFFLTHNFIFRPSSQDGRTL